MYLHTFEVRTEEGDLIHSQAFWVYVPNARVRVRHRVQRIDLPDRDDDPLPGGEDWGDWEEFPEED